MRIARFTTGDDPRFALLEGETLRVITGDPLYTEVQPTGPIRRASISPITP